LTESSNCDIIFVTKGSAETQSKLVKNLEDARKKKAKNVKEEN